MAADTYNDLLHTAYSFDLLSDAILGHMDWDSDTLRGDGTRFVRKRRRGILLYCAIEAEVVQQMEINVAWFDDFSMPKINFDLSVNIGLNG